MISTDDLAGSIPIHLLPRYRRAPPIGAQPQALRAVYGFLAHCGAH